MTITTKMAHLHQLEQLSRLLDDLPRHVDAGGQYRDFVYLARRKIKGGEELNSIWSAHLLKCLTELGDMHRFDADSESSIYR